MSTIKRYKSLSLFLGGIILAIIISKIPVVQNFLISLHGLGYLGALIGGMFYVYSFTVGFGVMILTILSRNLPTFPLVIIAGLGAVLGDSLVFKLTKDTFKDEIKDLYKRIDKKQTLKKAVYSRKLKWLLLVLGLFVIGSPFPNEFGVMLLGISNIKKSHFRLLSFFLNSTGIYLLTRILG